MADHLRTHVVDQYVVGVLSDDDRAAVDHHIAGCAECAERIDRERAEASLFLALHPPQHQADLLVGQRKHRPWLWPALAGAGSAVAIAAIVFSVWPDPPSSIRDSHEILFKGQGTATEAVLEQLKRAPAPGVRYTVERKSQLLEGQDGAPLRPGDRLRIFVHPGKSTNVAVLGLEAGGKAEKLSATAGLRPSPQMLPVTLTLDASPRLERIFVVFSSRSLPLPRLTSLFIGVEGLDERELARLDVSQLPPVAGVIVRSVLIRKKDTSHAEPAKRGDR